MKTLEGWKGNMYVSFDMIHPLLFSSDFYLFLKLSYEYCIFIVSVQNSFRFTITLRGRYRDFPYTPCSHTCTASAIINIWHWSGTFHTIFEPTWTHHYHSKSMVYIRNHSWCYIFCEFWQTYDDMYPPL